jgi:UDP-4-amino-4,6-dideoxy-N-acetyl-beta-L-altrosamine N-acetyltransferase
MSSTGHSGDVAIMRVALMFEHAGVRIRPIEEEDLVKLVELRSQPGIWEFLGSIEMIGLEKQREWFKALQGSPSARYYVLCAADVDFIGVVRSDEIDSVNRSIRVGGDIHPKFQGKGYGAKMFGLLKKYCFDYLNMHRMWLLVMENNERAISLYRKSGFVEEGRQRQAIYRDGRYLDYIMMSILRSEYDEEQRRR